MASVVATRPPERNRAAQVAHRHDRPRVAFGGIVMPTVHHHRPPAPPTSRPIAIPAAVAAPATTNGRARTATRETSSGRASATSRTIVAPSSSARAGKSFSSAKTAGPKPPFVVADRYTPSASASTRNNFSRKTSTTNTIATTTTTSASSSKPVVPVRVTTTIQKLKPTLPPPIECTACSTLITDRATVLRAPGCRHPYCLDCLKRRILLCTTDETLYPPTCCPTGSPFPNITITKILTADELKQYSAAEVQWKTPPERRIYCPNNTAGLCGRFIPLPSSVKVGNGWGKIKCKSCKTEICLNCKQRFHLESTLGCSDEGGLRIVLKMAKEMGWQRCYSCKSMVERTEGCPYMVCRCNAEFCYHCGKRYNSCVCGYRG